MSVENRLQETVTDIGFQLLAIATGKLFYKKVINVKVADGSGTIYGPNDYEFGNVVGKNARFVLRNLRRKTA